MLECNVQSCTKPRKGFSIYCSNHHKTKARHGHPLQKPVTAQELKPYIKAVALWFEERARGDTEDLLRRTWIGLVHEAERYRRLANKGHPFFKNLLEAYDIILSANQSKDFKAISNTMLAMGYLYEANPKRFADENAFGFQCARRLRALSDCSFGSRWDHQSSRVQKVYRDVSPKTLRVLWKLILDTKFPVYGIKIGKLDLKERSQWVPDEEIITQALMGEAA